MFRYFLASILIISFTAQMLGGFVVEIDYHLRTASYADNCVNKDKPMMHCNGKCQMVKKMQQEEKKDQQVPERKSLSGNDITLFSKTSFATINLPVSFITPAIKSRYVSSSISFYSLDIFHPPQNRV